MMRGDSATVLIANPGADLYGSDRMVIETARSLTSAGRRVVVTVPDDGPLVPLLKGAGAHVVVLPTPVVRKGLLSLSGLWTLLRETVTAIRTHSRLLRRYDPGTVIVNTITPPLWMPLSRLGRRYTICHVHEGEGSISPLLKRALYLPLVFCNRILINSEFSLEVLSSAAPWLRQRTRVVYNAVAGPSEVAPPRSSATSPVRLLYVGRLSRRKGPHVAVEALRLLLDVGVDARLAVRGAVFGGNEGYQAELEALVGRLGLTDYVALLGFSPSVWDDLAASDIALVPSTVDEPFGNTAVEAALAARPAVVSSVGGLPEAVAYSTSAVLVPPGDARALSDAVVRIVDRWQEFSTRATVDSVAVAAAFSSARYADEIMSHLPASRQ